MTTKQTAIIIQEALREACRDCECKPSEALDPPWNHRAALAARNAAIRLAHAQGVDTSLLGIAFKRSTQTIRNVLAERGEG